MYPYRSEFSIIIESKPKVSLYFLNCHYDCVVIPFHEKKKNNFQIQRLRNNKFCSIDITRYTIQARFFLTQPRNLESIAKNVEKHR